LSKKLEHYLTVAAVYDCRSGVCKTRKTLLIFTRTLARKAVTRLEETSLHLDLYWLSPPVTYDKKRSLFND
jgi:hypothetical protein